MSATPSLHNTTRLTGFAAASLWHRRMARAGTQNIIIKAQPRLCAELVLHPIPRDRATSAFTDVRRAVDVFHAA